jgi:hypothetical protein
MDKWHLYENCNGLGGFQKRRITSLLLRIYLFCNRKTTTTTATTTIIDRGVALTIHLHVTTRLKKEWCYTSTSPAVT